MNQKEFISKPEISFWIPVITAIVSASLAWGTLSNKLNIMNEQVDYMNSKGVILRQDMEAMEERVDSTLTKHDQVLLDIQVRLAEIQKDVLWIKERLD